MIISSYPENWMFACPKPVRILDGQFCFTDSSMLIDGCGLRYSNQLMALNLIVQLTKHFFALSEECVRLWEIEMIKPPIQVMSTLQSAVSPTDLQYQGKWLLCMRSQKI